MKHIKRKFNKVEKRLDKLNSKISAQLKSYQDFLQFLYQVGSETTTEEELLSLYNKTINISFNNHKIKLSFDAVNYNNLVHLVEQAIKEY